MLEHFVPSIHPINLFTSICYNEENEIVIGATISHFFSIPFNYSKYVNSCEIIYHQDLDFSYVKTDFEKKEFIDHTDIIVTLTPEETKLFKKNSLDTFVQIRIVNNKDEVMYDEPHRIKIKKPLKVD